MIDRSFSDLKCIAKQQFQFLPHFFQMITMWENPDCANDYLSTKCYKVLGQDPNDEIITDPCSLKTGVSLALIKQELVIAYQKANFREQINDQKPAKIDLDDYFHILGREETEIFFKTLKTVFEQIFEFEIDNRLVRRRFCMVGTASEAPEGEQSSEKTERLDTLTVDSSTQRAVNSRLKRTQKYEDQYNKTF